MLLLVACLLAVTQPALVHPHKSRKLQQQQQQAVATTETDAAVDALLSTAQYVQPAITAAEDDVMAAAASAAPIGKRACGTAEGSKGLRAANERRFQQRLQQLSARGEDVSVAQAPVIEVYFHVLMLNKTKGMMTQVRHCGKHCQRSA
jgi:hypothetical protein